MVDSPHVDILIPVYNEGDNIWEALDNIYFCVKIPFNIYLIYDFEEDNTLKPASDYIQNKNVENIVFLKNMYGRGVLNALKTGFDHTESEWLVVTMADLSDPPEVINNMYSSALKNKWDIVCASRYMKGGKQVGGPVIKKILSRLAGWSLNKLVRIPTLDVTNNFKLYNRRVLDSISIESSGGFEVAMEITIKAFVKGFLIGEVPTHWMDRHSGESKFVFYRWLPKYLRWYLYALFNRKLRV